MTLRKTGEMIPNFEVKLLNGGAWNSRYKPQGQFTLLTVYRGMWCPNCKQQLCELDQLNDEFLSRGVDILAASADTQDRAQSTVSELGLKRLRVGYEMPIDSARELGLFISHRIKEEEMPLFCEPGTFLVDDKSRIFAAWIASNAFARTSPGGVLSYIDFIAQKRHRPPRGSA